MQIVNPLSNLHKEFFQGTESNLIQQPHTRHRERSAAISQLRSTPCHREQSAAITQLRSTNPRDCFTAFAMTSTVVARSAAKQQPPTTKHPLSSRAKRGDLPTTEHQSKRLLHCVRNDEYRRCKGAATRQPPTTSHPLSSRAKRGDPPATEYQSKRLIHCIRNDSYRRCKEHTNAATSHPKAPTSLVAAMTNFDSPSQ